MRDGLKRKPKSGKKKCEQNIRNFLNDRHNRHGGIHNKKNVCG